MPFPSRRNYGRRKPYRLAKKIHILCEGDKEVDYFRFFAEMDSRLDVRVIPPDQDNSPTGLLNKAKNIYAALKRKGEFRKIDEIWLVFDNDTYKNPHRIEQIKTVYDEAARMENWFTAQSHPCFEVWLYYHGAERPPASAGMEHCATWKQTILPKVFPGGFDNRKHPALLGNAIENARKNFCKTPDGLCPGSTEVFRLGERIFGFVKNYLSE